MILCEEIEREEEWGGRKRERERRKGRTWVHYKQYVFQCLKMGDLGSDHLGLHPVAAGL